MHTTSRTLGVLISLLVASALPAQERKELGLIADAAAANRPGDNRGASACDPGYPQRRLADVMAEVLSALRTGNGGARGQERSGTVPAMLDWPAF